MPDKAPLIFDPPLPSLARTNTFGEKMIYEG